MSSKDTVSGRTTPTPATIAARNEFIQRLTAFADNRFATSMNASPFIKQTTEGFDERFTFDVPCIGLDGQPGRCKWTYCRRKPMIWDRLIRKAPPAILFVEVQGPLGRRGEDKTVTRDDMITSFIDLMAESNRRGIWYSRAFMVYIWATTEPKPKYEETEAMLEWVKLDTSFHFLARCLKDIHDMERQGRPPAAILDLHEFGARFESPIVNPAGHLILPLRLFEILDSLDSLLEQPPTPTFLVENFPEFDPFADEESRLAGVPQRHYGTRQYPPWLEVMLEQLFGYKAPLRLYQVLENEDSQPSYHTGVRRRQGGGPRTSSQEILTLSNLYKHGLLTNPGGESKFRYDESLNKRVSIWRGDITSLKVCSPARSHIRLNIRAMPSVTRTTSEADPSEADMIVNTAIESLLGTGNLAGVDGAIHRAAGPELLQECRKFGGAKPGETAVTKGYNLPAKLIAHTVVPDYSSSRSAQCKAILASCYLTSLDQCALHGGGTIGFPSIGTGFHRFPILDAAHIALETVRVFLERDVSITRVIFVLFSDQDEGYYQGIAPQYFPGPSPSAVG